MSIVDKYLYLKFYINRAMSHASLIFHFVSTVGVLILVLKDFDLLSFPIIIFLSVLSCVLLAVIGYFDVKFKIADREATISNRYNPEIQRILKNTRGVRK